MEDFFLRQLVQAGWLVRSADFPGGSLPPGGACPVMPAILGITLLGGTTVGVAVVVDGALVLGLGELLAPRTFVRLFRNDREVLPGSTLLDFEPCLFPGYLDVELTVLWPTPVIRGTGQAWSGEIPLLWTRGPGGVADTAFGWVVFQDPDPTSVLLAGRRVPRPWPMVVEGQKVAFNLSSYLIRGY